MIEPTYAERLRETIERKIRLRSVFTSRALIEDNEREIRKAQLALRAAEGSSDAMLDRALCRSPLRGQ
jgi:hypothetical protein